MERTVSFTFLTISVFLRNQSDTITAQATGRGHSNSRGSLEPGKDKNEEVFLISLIFPILMTKQCVNEEVIKDIFVMTCHEFPNHSISIISDDWHIWWDVCMSSCYSQSTITSMTSHYNDWYMCGIPSHIIYNGMHLYVILCCSQYYHFNYFLLQWHIYMAPRHTVYMYYTTIYCVCRCVSAKVRAGA